MDLETLLDYAAGVNANYRNGDDDRLEIGFLYGTAEMILAIIGLRPDESYHDRREELAQEIDRRAVKEGAGYYLLHEVRPS